MSGAPLHREAEPRPDLSSLAAAERVAAVERLLAAGPPGRVVERLTSVAAQLLGAPCAQVSLLAGTEQVVAAAAGVAYDPAVRTPAAESLCSVTAALGRPFAVEDAAGHPWVYDLPPVTSGAVGSYLGVVLTDAGGTVLGSLCVFGGEPRAWSDDDVDTLTVLGDAVADELEHAADAG